MKTRIPDSLSLDVPSNYMSHADDLRLGISGSTSDPATVVTLSLTTSAILVAILYGFVQHKNLPSFKTLPIFLYQVVFSLLICLEIYVMIQYIDSTTNIPVLGSIGQCPNLLILNNIGGLCLLSVIAFVLLIDREYLWWRNMKCCDKCWLQKGCTNCCHTKCTRCKCCYYICCHKYYTLTLFSFIFIYLATVLSYGICFKPGNNDNDNIFSWWVLLLIGEIILALFFGFYQLFAYVSSYFGIVGAIELFFYFALFDHVDNVNWLVLLSVPLVTLGLFAFHSSLKWYTTKVLSSFLSLLDIASDINLIVLWRAYQHYFWAMFQLLMILFGQLYSAYYIGKDTIILRSSQHHGYIYSYNKQLQKYTLWQRFLIAASFGKTLLAIKLWDRSNAILNYRDYDALKIWEIMFESFPTVTLLFYIIIRLDVTNDASVTLSIVSSIAAISLSIFLILGRNETHKPLDACTKQVDHVTNENKPVNADHSTNVNHEHNTTNNGHHFDTQPEYPVWNLELQSVTSVSSVSSEKENSIIVNDENELNSNVQQTVCIAYNGCLFCGCNRTCMIQHIYMLDGINYRLYCMIFVFGF